MKHSGVAFQFITVYGVHNINARTHLWTSLKQLHRNIQEPWLVMGDFNVVLSQDDKPIGNLVQAVEIRDFKELLTDYNMTELQTRWSNFIWGMCIVE